MNHITDISEILLQLGLDSRVTEHERAIAQVSLQAAEAAVRRHLTYEPVKSAHTEFYPNTDMRREGRIGIWEVNDTHAYVRYLSEFVTNELQVRHFPIRTITSLWIDYDGRSGTRAGSFGSSTLKVEGSDYWANYDLIDSDGNKVCRDGIIRSMGVWPDLPGSVKILYTAGYSIEELHGQDSVIDASPINDAVINESIRRFHQVYARAKKRVAGFVGPMTSEHLGDYSYTTDSAILARMVGGTTDLLPETIHKLQEFQRYDLGVM